MSKACKIVHEQNKNKKELRNKMSVMQSVSNDVLQQINKGNKIIGIKMTITLIDVML